MDQETLSLLLTKIAIDVADLKKGVRESRSELESLKSMAQGVGASVKKALAFTGITIGIYELASALKSFAEDAAKVGARTETLDIAMKQVGKTYGVSADSLKYYVDELKTAGITTQESMQAVSKFLISGLPLDQLKALATRARDIAVVAGVNTSEALNRIIQGVITGEQETLRRMMIQVGASEEIFKRYADSLGKTKEQLNSVEKAQAMLNEVMRLSAGFAGVAAEADASVGKQLASMARFAEEAKNALWAFFGPVMLEIVQQMTKGWKELKAWADANETSLRAWGNTIADLIEKKVELIAVIGKFLAQNKELVLALLQFKLFSTAAGWLVALGRAAVFAGAGLKTLATGITAVNLAMDGWLVTLIKLVMALAAYGAYETIKKPTALSEMSPEEAQLIGEAWILKGPTPAKALPVPGSEGEGHVGIESPAERKARADREAKAAIDKARRDAPKPAGKEGKGGKDDNLLAPTLAMYKAIREVELQAAQNSLDLLKATNEKKRAELDKALAEGLIDGQAYYQRLQELQQAETAAALAMIEQKRQAQQKTHQESLKELSADEKLSDAAKGIARQKLEAENRKALAKLDTEAVQARLEGEVKVTNELKRQVEVKKEYQQKTEDLNLETAELLGQISEQEAKLQKLYLDWQRAKEAAIKAGGYTPEYAAALETNIRAKMFEASYSGQKFQSASQILTSGIGDFVNTLWEGGVKISQALDTLGKKILQDTFKLFFDDLAKAISQGIKSLANSIARELQSGGGGGFGAFFSGIGNWLRGLFGGGGGGSGSINLGATYGYSGWFGHGAAFSRGLRLAAFGRGGIVTRPTLFPMANGMGLMGEEGEEGVLPLERIGGDLGVKALLPKSGPPQVQVINNLGVEAKPTVQQDDQGGLRITLERAVARMITDGGPVQQALLATLNVNKRF